MNVNDVRIKIDLIDQKIVNLLGERARLVNQVGILKQNSIQIKDIRREQQILSRLKSQAIEEGLDPAFIEKIYKQFFDYFIICQRNIVKKTKCE